MLLGLEEHAIWSVLWHCTLCLADAHWPLLSLGTCPAVQPSTQNLYLFLLSGGVPEETSRLDKGEQRALKERKVAWACSLGCIPRIMFLVF